MKAADMSADEFGRLDDDRAAHLFRLQNGQGQSATITDYGARLVSFLTPDSAGDLRQIVLGCSDLASYCADTCCLGAIIGRNANRISNAQFQLNGRTYRLAANDGKNNNHSGPDGYEHRLWTTVSYDDRHVTLRMDTPDGDQGFPGAMSITVCYRLQDDGLEITFEGATDADTICNLTNHAYFNLDGDESGNILDHALQINADTFCPIISEDAIPTGSRQAVADTPMDFRKPCNIGKRRDPTFDQIRLGHGYNHAYPINKSPREFDHMATLTSAKTGIRLDVFSDLPAIQMYTGDYLSNTRARDGHCYGPREGIALECEFVPNAINSDNPIKPILRAGDIFAARICYRTSIIS